MFRIIYMGTPQFAVPALEALIKGSTPGVVLPEGYEIVAVLTRPDKPTGRGRKIAFSPVKQAALQHGLPVWQPGSLKRPEHIEALAAFKADLYIVAAFGQILPQAVLDQPRYGTLNIHASLLPRYRGVSPISEAILQGDRETGVTIMLLDAGVDTGPILLKRGMPLSDEETTGSLTPKLAALGAQALIEVLPQWLAGTITPVPQAGQEASYTHMLRKEDGEISWQASAIELARKVRACTPWPGAYSHWCGKLVKIVSAQALPISLETAKTPAVVGTVLLTNDKKLCVVTGEGLLMVTALQLEGKKAVTAAEFLRGYPRIVGAVLE
jgi:methionyl-tRNA formyltransferase